MGKCRCGCRNITFVQSDSSLWLLASPHSIRVVRVVTVMVYIAVYWMWTAEQCALLRLAASTPPAISLTAFNLNVIHERSNMHALWNMKYLYNARFSLGKCNCISFQAVAFRGRGGGWGVQTPPKFRRPFKIVPNSTKLWKLLQIVKYRTPTLQDVRKKGQ